MYKDHFQAKKKEHLPLHLCAQHHHSPRSVSAGVGEHTSCSSSMAEPAALSYLSGTWSIPELATTSSATMLLKCPVTYRGDDIRRGKPSYLLSNLSVPPLATLTPETGKVLPFLTWCGFFASVLCIAAWSPPWILHGFCLNSTVCWAFIKHSDFHYQTY